MGTRSLFVLVVVLGLALAQSGGTSSIGQAIGDAVNDASTNVVPAMLTFMGVLVSIALGWAVVRVIRG